MGTIGTGTTWFVTDPKSKCKSESRRPNMCLHGRKLCKQNNFRPLGIANNNTFQVLSLNPVQEQVPHNNELKLARSQSSTIT
jgi:hypothetical protein